MSNTATKLAEKIGVSRATISRALNRPESLSPAMLAKVHSAAKALHLDLRIRSPRGRRAKYFDAGEEGPQLAVWFIGSDEKNAYRFLGEQMSYLKAASESAGASIKFVFSATPDEIPDEVVNHEFNALLLEGVQPSTRVIDAIAGMPSVWVLTRKSADYPGDYVEPDNEANGRMAADFLIQRGHAHFAYITTEPEYPAFARRETAFKSRVAEHGGRVARITASPHDPKLHMLPPPTDEEGRELTAQLLACDPMPRAVYTPNFFCTGMIQRGLRRAGMDPACLDWVVGHSDAYIQSQLDPRPAVVDINVGTITSEAVQLALRRINNPGMTGRVGIQISPTLYPADSAQNANGDAAALQIPKNAPAL
jgi:DNA-binding LacI/PurR family transcriptional regulator